ncbi:MAG: L-threonylcarbamoyladenylate synthase, partial [Planctomycetota bacterium]
MATVLHIDPRAPDASAIRAAADAIRAGKIVAFPTETVYGLGVRFDRPDAIARLRTAKGRPETQPFTLHVATPEQALQALGRQLPPPARMLADRYWPGPVTLVVPARDDTMLGLRVVGDAIARDVILAAGVPVIATSANRHGQPAAVSGADVRLQIPDAADLILDAGPTQLQEASSVVACAPRAYKVLREGVVSAAAIQRTVREHVCFVCTGNICRSPMAEALLNRMIEQSADRWLDRPWEPQLTVTSAGVRAMIGEQITREAVRALEDFGAVKYGEGLRGKMITQDLLDRCNYIFVMTREHIRPITSIESRYADMVELLDPAGKDVDDPYGEPLTIYRKTARRLFELIEKR